LQIELGVIVMISTIVIGALENNKNQNEFLTMTSEEASWFGEYMKINALLYNKIYKYALYTLF
jgi:hypothetical protein